MNSHQLPPVIVGTDLSLESDDAIHVAAAWAKRNEAPLEIVHVGPFGMFQNLQNRQVKDALLVRLEGLVESLDVPSKIVGLEGDAPEELVRHAETRAARLMVVAASTKGATKRLLLGSTAQQVARRSPCPVLVVRSPSLHGPVVVGTDFSEPAAYAVKAGAREARARGVPLVLVHSVFQPDPLAVLGPAVVSIPVIAEEQRATINDAAETMLGTLLENTGVSGSTQVAAGEPGRSIVSAAEVSGAGLVVVATHGRTGLARMALGSVAEFVMHRAPCSVLVVRREE